MIQSQMAALQSSCNQPTQTCQILGFQTGSSGGAIRVRSPVDIISLECCLDLILVEICEQGKVGCEMRVVKSQRVNESHASEFVIKLGQMKGRGTKFLHPSYGMLDSGSESSEGLFRAFSDAKELIIGDKMSSSLLLDKEVLQSLPSSNRIILMLPDVYPLVRSNMEHDFPSSLILLCIPGRLLSRISGRTEFLAINKAPETFGTQICLHLVAPGGVVGAI